MNAAPVQRQLYGIGIFEEEIVLSDFTADGEQRFLVSPEQLMDFFRTEVVFRPFSGLVWMKTDGHGERYLFTLPAAERPILYRPVAGKEKLDAYRLRLPAMAVLVSVKAATRNIDSIKLWGFTGKVLADDSVLYELPLPNLSDFRLCLGSTERVAIGDNISAAAERVIFDTPFNHHNHIVGTARMPFCDYVKKYKGRCPLHTLKRLCTGRALLEDRL